MGSGHETIFGVTIPLKMTAIPIGPPGRTTVFENVPPDTYSLRVTATAGVEEAVVFWKVYVPARPTICSVNLINFGLAVNGTRATVEFQGVGPTSGFSCRLDNGQFDSCELFANLITLASFPSFIITLRMCLNFNHWLCSVSVLFISTEDL